MANETPRQVPLQIRLQTHATFGSYVAGANAEAVKACESLARIGSPGGPDKASLLYIVGVSSSGKSHLLQATVSAAVEAGHEAAYLPLSTFRNIGDPHSIEDMDHLSVLCLDDIDAVAGDPEWEHALFILVNRRLERRLATVIAARHAAASLGLRLPDLRSRLQAGLTLPLKPLTDMELDHALDLHAQARGLSLSEAARKTLLERCTRSIAGVLSVLDALDNELLETQRRPTVAFVRDFLKRQG